MTAGHLRDCALELLASSAGLPRLGPAAIDAFVAFVLIEQVLVPRTRREQASDWRPYPGRRISEFLAIENRFIL